MVIGCVIAGPLIHPVALEKLTLPLIMQFILLEVRIVVRVVALAPLMLSVLAVELEIAQFLDIDVEVHRPLFFLAALSLLPREGTANLMRNLHGRSPLRPIPLPLRILTQQGLMQYF